MSLYYHINVRNFRVVSAEADCLCSLSVQVSHNFPVQKLRTLIKFGSVSWFVDISPMYKK